MQSEGVCSWVVERAKEVPFDVVLRELGYR